MKELKELIKHKLKKNKVIFSKLQFLAGDASNRKYFRLFQKNTSKVVMYDNLGSKSIENFVNKSSLFFESGIRVPAIYQSFPDDGILLMEYFGNSKFSKILNNSNEYKLYKLATDTLISLHKKNRKEELEFYSKKKFIDEVNLFFDWFLPLYSKSVSTKKKKEFIKEFKKLLDIPMKLPRVTIHRDFHVDNIFYLKKKINISQCGWIDYQDALFGTCVYDLMSLLEDARRDISKNLKGKIIKYYIEHFPKIDEKLFIYSFKIIAVQRHLKVLGIFSRLFVKDKKNEYLNHIPRVIRLLKLNLKFEKLKSLSEFISPLIKNKESYD